MSSAECRSNTSWTGLRFFVCVDTLFSLEPVDPDHLVGRPGRPEQRHFIVDGKPRAITSYPAASFFLETLSGTGGTVIVVSSWRKEKTWELLGLFGWKAFSEVRTIHPEPGREKLHLACVECNATEYGVSLVVTNARDDWCSSMHPQVIEVNHGKNQIPHSLALLRALSSCLRLSEWHIRLPHIPIASCAALCRSRLFSHCRFFLEPEACEDTTVALSINEHGGYIVEKANEATHCVVSGPFSKSLCDILRLPTRGAGAEPKVNLSAAHDTTEEAVAAPGSVTTDPYTSGPMRGEVDKYEENVMNERDDSTVNAESSCTGPNDEMLMVKENVDDEGPECSIERDSFPQNDDEALAEPEGLDGRKVALVGIQWLKDCVDGLFMYPPQVSHTSSDGCDWNVTVLFLAALLPPGDAEPLLLSGFNRLVEGLGFRPLPLHPRGDCELLDVMREHWGGVLRTEEKGDELLLWHTSVYTQAFNDEMDRHLKFVANQFCAAWAQAARRGRAFGAMDAGTQTAVPITVTFGTNTEIEPPALLQPPPQPLPLLQPPEVTVTPIAPNGGVKEPASAPLPFLMRALGPAEWAKEVEAPRSPLPHSVTDSLPHQDSLSFVEDATAVGNSAGDELKEATGCLAVEDVNDTATTAEVPEEAPTSEQPFEKCFISTESLGGDRELLERIKLERQLPFRNYPIKLSIAKSGIVCQFPTAADAKRFREEGTVEILNQSLPIKPVYDMRAEAPVPLERKRRRSVSPGVVNAQAGSLSLPIRREGPIVPHGLVPWGRVDTGWSTENEGDVLDLSEEENGILNALGITRNYALENLGLLEHYCQTQLSGKKYRKERVAVVKLLEKLRVMNGLNPRPPL